MLATPKQADAYSDQNTGYAGDYRIFENVWVLRILAALGGIFMSSLLMVYTFLFLFTFFALRNTTSYFPWAWQVFYVSFGSVMNQFYFGLSISTFFIVLFVALLHFFFVPGLRKSLQYEFDSRILKEYA
jgi:hypothetical protein